MKRLEAERDEVAAKLALIQDKAKVIALHPAALEQYRRDVTWLCDLTTEHSRLPEF